LHCCPCWLIVMFHLLKPFCCTVAICLILQCLPDMYSSVAACCQAPWTRKVFFFWDRCCTACITHPWAEAKFLVHHFLPRKVPRNAPVQMSHATCTFQSPFIFHPFIQLTSPYVCVWWNFWCIFLYSALASYHAGVIKGVWAPRPCNTNVQLGTKHYLEGHLKSDVYFIKTEKGWNRPML
jgi:hypothetical protein